MMSTFGDNKDGSFQGPLALTQVCAKVIVLWHANNGLAAAKECMSSDTLHEYQAAVNRFAMADYGQRAVQEEIARTQLAGIFEYFYGAPLPIELWRHVSGGHVMAGQPQNLAEAARWILHGPPQIAPEGGRPQSRRVRFRSCEELLDAAHEFYADLRQEEQLKIGGANVLLSTSLQLWPHGEERDETYEQQLARPEALGLRVLRPEEHSDGLIAAMRSGSVVLENAVGGPRVQSDCRDRPQ